jgi:hypothetical protein
MAQPYKSGVWPYRTGTHPRPVPEPLNPSAETPESEPDLDAEATCAHCGAPSVALRPNGWFRSIRSDERRQCVVCTNCGRGCYLPLGVHLERKPKKQVLEQFIVAEDQRPTCPFCSGNRIVRKGILSCGSQRWCCIPCARRFVSKAFRHATLDRRKVSHWEPDTEPDNAIEEAHSLFVLVETESDVAEIRELIVVSEREQMVAAFFTARELVAQVIGFRDQVLEEFDRLIEEKRRMFFNNLVSGPNSPGNYQQPNSTNPPETDVANFPVGSNPLQVVEPVPEYYQPGSTSAVTGRGPVQGAVPGMFGAGNEE